MNKGVALSKGEWLYFLGADDCLFSSNSLNLISGALEETADILLGAIQYDIKTSDSAFVKKNKGVFISKWSFIMWIKNTTHHQSIFYNRRVFDKNKYATHLSILADYALNLKLFKKKITVKTTSIIIASCKTTGVSKSYGWELYQEEIQLKTALSSKLLQPLFFTIAALKYMIKKGI